MAIKVNRQNLSIGLLLFLATFSVFWPIFIDGKAIVGKWTLFDQYPRLAFISRALANGESVLWTDNFLGGFPIYLGVWGEHLQPLTQLLFGLFDYIAVSHWLIFFNTFLSGLLMYLLVRNLSLSKSAALLSSFVYMFNQWHLFYSSMLFWGNVYPLIPLLFLSILKISQGRRWYWVWGVLAVTIGWLSVMADVILYVTIAAFLFALFLDWPAKREKKFITTEKKFITTRYFLTMALTGIVLSLSRILPVVDFIELSTRAGGVEGGGGFLRSADSNGYIGINSLISLFYPYFSILYSDFIPFFKGADKLTFLYFGIIPLFLSATFFLGVKEILKKNKLAKYFTALFIITLLMLIKYIPIYYAVHQLPIFKLFGGTGKYTFLSFFSLAIICGLSLDYLSVLKETKNFKKFVRFLRYFSGAILSLAVVGNLILVFLRINIIKWANDYFVKNLYFQATTQRPLEHYQALIEKTFSLASDNILFTNFHFAAAMFFVFISAFIFHLYAKGKLNDSRFKKAVVVITLLNFLILWQGFFTTVPRKVLTELPASLEFIKERQRIDGFFRTFRFWGGLSKYVDLGLNDRNLEDKSKLEIAMLAPNYSLLHGIDFVGGHENIMSLRQARIMALVGSESAPGQQTWIFDRRLPLLLKLSRFQSAENRRLLSMMNVKYVLTSFEFQPPWRKVFESKVTTSNIPVLIYENPEVLPRIYFAKDVEFIEPNEQSAYGELLQIRDFNRTTLIECLKPQCLNAFHQSDPGDEINILEMKSGYLKILTRTKHPRWLVYSESNLPTWEAKLLSNVQGLKTKALDLSHSSLVLPIYTANYLFQTVYVPPGENEIEFKYPGAWKQMNYAIKRQISKLLSL